MDSRDNCWEYFIDKVRDNLHVILCFSPVGDGSASARASSPRSPTCSVIDWFLPWPEEALISVAQRFLEDVDLGDGRARDEVRENVMPHGRTSTRGEEDVRRVPRQERRDNYTTPKSFLELIALYKKLLVEKTANARSEKVRLETGLVKLRSSAAQVAEMQVQLKDEMVVVEQKKAETDELLVAGRAGEGRRRRAGGARQDEEQKVAAMQNEVSAFEAQCAADLAAAEPAIQKAAEALNNLDKKALVELKSLSACAEGGARRVSAVGTCSPKPGRTSRRSTSRGARPRR